MRLIDADELRFEIVKYFAGLPIQVHYDMLKMVDEAPTIEGEPVKHGKWIMNEYLYPICSVCGTNYEYEALEVDPTAWNYCPCCGAKMKPISASPENG